MLQAAIELQEWESLASTRQAEQKASGTSGDLRQEVQPQEWEQALANLRCLVAAFVRISAKVLDLIESVVAAKELELQLVVSSAKDSYRVVDTK